MTANKFAAAADGMDGRAERAIEFQRRFVLLCREFGIGNHPLTGAKPTRVPLLDWSGNWLHQHQPEFCRRRELLLTEFADAKDSFQWSRHVEFSERDLGS